MSLTNPTATEIFPSADFLVTSSDFTMSLYLGSDAPQDLPDPSTEEIYLEDFPPMMVRVKYRFHSC